MADLPQSTWPLCRYALKSLAHADGLVKLFQHPQGGHRERGSCLLIGPPAKTRCARIACRAMIPAQATPVSPDPEVSMPANR
jgi:hypothetical protein